MFFSYKKSQKDMLKDKFPKMQGLTKLQLEMLQRLENQSERQVTWIYDEKGNNGKTWLSKYLIANHKAAYYTNCKSADIAHAYNNEQTIIFDFSRSLEGRVNYTILEQLKNGILFSSKYSSKHKIFDTPKMIIMANFYPDTKELSEDRWDIMTI
jgi:hypothetical protein